MLDPETTLDMNFTSVIESEINTRIPIPPMMSVILAVRWLGYDKWSAAT